MKKEKLTTDSVNRQNEYQRIFDEKIMPMITDRLISSNYDYPGKKTITVDVKNILDKDIMIENFNKMLSRIRLSSNSEVYFKLDVDCVDQHGKNFIHGMWVNFHFEL